MTSILLVIVILCILTLSQIQDSNNLETCIPNEIVFVCIRLNSVTALSYYTSHRIYASASLSYIDPFTSYPATQNINSKTTTSTTVNNIGLISCVPTLQTNIASITEYSVTLKNRDDNDRTIGTITVNDLTDNQQFNISNIKPNDIPLDITLSDNKYFASSVITSSVDISISIWIANRQCMQIKYGDMFAEDEYMISVDLYRSSSSDIITFSSQATINNYGSITWNEPYICLPSTPSSSDVIISAGFTLYSTTALSGIDTNNIAYINNMQQCQYSNGTQTILHFDIGDVTILYVASCDYIGFICDTDSMDTNVNININKLDICILLFVIILLVIGGILLIIASYTSKHTWKSSDPVKFDHIIYFILFFWTSVSQLAFIFYLFAVGVKDLFYVCLILFILSYIANIIALTHYLQIWNHALAPGVTRHWLQYWSWFLIMICVCFGNVNFALELCNCLIFPTIDIFAMHLPRAEIVNARIYRFWTNSLCLDLPFCVVVLIYISQYNMNRFIVWNTLIICFLSFICTIIFAILRRSYSNKNPVALYKYSFTFKPFDNLFESYFIHSHQRIKQSFADLIQLRKPSLVIIDQCSEILGCMKVEGRILKDTKKTWDDSQMRALQNIQRNSQKLKDLLAVQFGLPQSQVTVENFQFVRMREINGQLVYDYDTAVKRFVECNICYASALQNKV